MGLSVELEKRLGAVHLEVRFQTGEGPLALLGASGSGKSVTLRCIAGLLTPDRGRIVLDGRVLFDSAAHINLPPRRRRVGYLFQQYALFPHWTVRENIAAAAPDRSRRQAVTAELLRRFRLEDAASLRPGQLSGGQQQRTALARLLAAEPRAILLDEPLSALDGFLRDQVELELAETLEGFSGPAVWVSHDRGEVFRACRQVCVLEGGRSLPVCGTEELFRRPASEAAARLAGWENLLEAVPRGDGVFLPQWGRTLACGRAVPEGVRRAGFRSAQVRPAPPGAENALPCRVVRVIRDLEGVTALLRPEGAPEGAPLLRMALERPPEGERLLAAILPEEILLWEA